MLTTGIDKIIAHLKDSVFNYHEGYFELPYLSNSPEAIIDFLKNMPFARHDEVEKAVYSNNIFTDGTLWYRELESDFWVIITEIEFKRNVAIRALYNGDCDYYFLSHALYTSLYNDTITTSHQIRDAGWSLYKPGTAIKSFFTAGDKGLFINFAFGKEWFKRNVPIDNLDTENSIRQYLSSKTDYITWNNIMSNSEALMSQVCDLIKRENQMPFNTLSLKMICTEVITRFFTNISAKHFSEPDATLRADDRQVIAVAEKILTDHLTSSFPGIEAIAAQLFISPSKLKNLFKTVYNSSLYQYYQQKQMQRAYELLKANKTSVKDVAFKLGYINHSKFSSAFKKCHGVLPSEV